jgi:putative tricarboxylic transport membrane protein
MSAPHPVSAPDPASPREARPVADRIVGGALVAAALAVGLEATTFDVVFLTDPVGPKALPALVAMMIGIGGLRVLVRPRDTVDLPDGPTWLRMSGAVAVFLGYAAALPFLGFFLSTTLVVAGLAILFGGPWKGGLAAGLTLSAALWLLFVYALALPLPVGELWIR